MTEMCQRKKNSFIVHFQRKRKEWIFGGFCWFLLKCFFFKRTRVLFLVGSSCINREDNYGPLKISKLSYFNVLDLADFMMYY